MTRCKHTPLWKGDDDYGQIFRNCRPHISIAYLTNISDIDSDNHYRMLCHSIILLCLVDSLSYSGLGSDSKTNYLDLQKVVRESHAALFSFSRYKHTHLWKGDEIMLLFIILTILVLVFALIATLLIGGAMGLFILIFSDLIVCIMLIVFLFKKLFSKKKNKKD